MDAVHLMRAITGRDLIIKIEGSYHGHHDAVMVAMYSDLDELGPSSGRGQRPGRPAASRKAIADLMRRRPVQRPRRASRRCSTEYEGRDRRHDHGAADDERRHHPAAARLPRGRAASSPGEHGVLLAFDEVKTGLTVGPGGATELLGVAARHRVPGQGPGRRRAVRRHRRHGRGDGGHRRRHATSRSGRSTATRSRWRRPGPPSPRCSRPRPTRGSTCSARRCSTGRSAALERLGVPAYGHRFGAKGCVVFNPQPGARTTGSSSTSTATSATSTGCIQHNGGVFLPPWGKSEQWTLSAQHTEEDADRFVTNVERFAEAVGQLDLAALRETGSYA